MSELGLNMEVEPSGGKDPESKGRGPLILAVSIFILVVIGIGAFFVGERILKNRNADYQGSGQGEVTVQVTQGQTLSAIGATLEENGVVASVQSFVGAAAANPQASSIAPGYYRLRQHMSGEEAVAAMLDPDNAVVVRISLPEGLRLTKVVKIISEESKIPPRRIEESLLRADKLGLPTFADGNPEGFLFPATYEFPPDVKSDDIIAAMLQRYNQAAEEIGFVRQAKKTGYTPYEVMVIASLVQAEGHPDDYGKVSRVIYNRLAAGMPLQLDATVNYARDTTKINLSEEELATSSPFNTYQNTGLPPTPINQPGEAAMQAALRPEPGPWLYFVAVNPDTGETKFTDNYDEFLRYQDEFEAYLKKNE